MAHGGNDWWRGTGRARATALAFAWMLAAGCGATTTEAPMSSGGEGADDVQAAEAEAPPRRLDDEEAARTQAQAMQTHVRAQELQSRCEQQGDRQACEQAEDLFRVAADTWLALVQGRSEDEASADWSFMLAQALLHSGRYVDAADSAAEYLDSGATEWRLPAARVGVTASERAIEADVLPVREQPPEPSGQPPDVEPLEMPAHVQRLFDARARFVEVAADDVAEQETVRRHRLANAELLYLYGHWEEAEPALRTVYTGACSGDGAWEGGAIAWRRLREMHAALGRWDAVRELGEELASRGCDFGSQETPSCTDESDHPQCLARSDAVTWRLQGGMRFLQRAERSRGEERRRFAERAGEGFLAALNAEGELDARGRVTALVQAGDAFRMAGAADRAADVDRRILRDVEPDDLEEEDRPFALVTRASAAFRLLESAIEAERNDEVVALARDLLADDLDLPELSTERARARSVLATTLAAMGRHADASRAFEAVAQAADGPSARREAELSAAFELLAAGSCRRAKRPLRDFVEAHRTEDGARDAVVRALWQLAECERSGSRAHEAALEAVAGDAGSGPLGTEARAHVAQASFWLADRGFDELSRLRIRLPRGDNVEDLVGALREELTEPSARVRDLVQGYAQVERIGDPRWSVAARYRSGLALEALERAVLEASWQIPQDLNRQRRELTRQAFEQLRGIVESRVHEILEAQAGPIRCRAARHYARAVEIAGAGDVQSDELAAARERLSSLEVPARCRSPR